MNLAPSADSPGLNSLQNGAPKDMIVFPSSNGRMIAFMCFSGWRSSLRQLLIHVDLI